MGRRGIAILSVWLAAAAAGQTLDLGPPEPPPLGDRSALAELRSALEDSASQREERRRALAAGASPTDADALALAVEAHARRIAARLLDLGPIGRTHALTLLSSLGALDGAIEAASAAAGDAGRAPAERESARLRLLGLERALADAEGALLDLGPGDAAGVDRALAAAFDELRPLLPPDTGPIPPAWPPAEAAPVVDFGALRVAAAAVGGDFGVQIGAVVDRLESVVRAGRRGPTALAAAESLAIGLAARARVLEQEALEVDDAALAEPVAVLAERLLDRRERAGAVRALRDLRWLGRMAGGLSTLAERRVDAAAAEAMLRRWIGAAPVEDAAWRDAHLAAARIVHTAATRPIEPPTPRPSLGLRRGWRELALAYERAERGALEIIPRLARDPAALSAPEVVTAIRRHQEAADDLALIVRALEVERRIRAQRGERDPAASVMVRGAVADRLDRLIDRLGEERVRPLIVEELSRFLPLLESLGDLPGEALLRAGDPRLAPALGGRHAELLDRLEAERRQWLASWTRGEEAAAELARARVELLARVLRVLADLAALADRGAMERLDRWAALELPSGGLEALTGRARALARPIAEGALAGDVGAMDAGLRAWDRRAVLVRTLARLAEASAERPSWPAHAGAAGLVAELGSPAPAGAWLIDHRGALAAIGPWVLELRHADERGDPDAAEAILDYLSATVEPLLAVLERPAAP